MLTRIHAKAMIDVVDSTLIEQASVLVQDKDIVWAGPLRDCPDDRPPDRELDLGERFLLPGLINSHLHLGIKPKTFDNIEFFDSFSSDPPERLSIYSAMNAKTELLSGVTCVRDCGATGSIIEQLRQAAQSTPMACPHIIHCGPIITVTGGHGHNMGAEADGIDALKKLIRTLALQGVDFVKIAATGGGTPGTKPHVSYFSQPELQEIIETAHTLDLKVAAHVRGVDGVKDTIAAGIDSMEHCDCELKDGSLTVMPRELSKMAEKCITMVPTIQLYKDLIDRGIRDNKDPQSVDALKRALEKKLESLEIAAVEGVNIVAGNDAGLPDTGFGELWKEMVIMSQNGMTNMQVLQSATIEAANLLSMDKTIGSINPEKSADIIAVKENPLEKIQTLAQVPFVMKQGTIYKNNS